MLETSFKSFKHWNKRFVYFSSYKTDYSFGKSTTFLSLSRSNKSHGAPCKTINPDTLAIKSFVGRIQSIYNEFKKHQSDFESLQHITTIMYISITLLLLLHYINGNIMKLYKFHIQLYRFKIFLSNIHFVNNSIIKWWFWKNIFIVQLKNVHTTRKHRYWQNMEDSYSNRIY